MSTNEATSFAASDVDLVVVQVNAATGGSNRGGPYSKPAFSYLATAWLPSSWDADNRHFDPKSFSHRHSAAAISCVVVAEVE